MWFIGVDVEQETTAPPPKKNPGSAPETTVKLSIYLKYERSWPQEPRIIVKSPSILCCWRQ